MFKNYTDPFLCDIFDLENSNVDCTGNLNDEFSMIWNGDWTLTEYYNKMLIHKLWEGKLVVNVLQNDQLYKEKTLILGIKTLFTFISYNWQAVPKELTLREYLQFEWEKDIDAAEKLQKDSEPVCVNIKHPELFYLASEIFDALYSVEPENFWYLWWLFRIKVTHQRILEDNSVSLFSKIELLTTKLYDMQKCLDDRPRARAFLLTEIGQAYLMYGRVEKAHKYMTEAQKLLGLKLELKGVLGKRTKHQQVSLPQLALSSTLESGQERPPTSAEGTYPPEVELDDDVRLSQVEYAEEVPRADLPGLEQTLCLMNVQYLEKAQPKDNLMLEELLPYIEMVLAQKGGPWSTRVAALLMRCKLEAAHKRTVERAMQQCEAIVADHRDVAPADSYHTSISGHWASGLSPAWTWRQQLGSLYLSLGLVKAALEEFLKIQHWEDVIVCYTMLQLRHKAAEVIQDQLSKKPTVKLYCLLGDATDDISCYEQAWEFSNQKSSRAQRHWGNYLFERKLYTECIPHYERSLEINSLQDRVWLRLGFAALETEQWELAGRAYRRYTYLQPTSFEAWNNLAKIYVNQDDKERAYKALMEALKFNYDNWKLWENVILISLSTNHPEDAVTGAHRLVELRGNFDDLEVLGRLVRDVLEKQGCIDEAQHMRYRKRVLELFGRITSIQRNNPEIWQLYADISPSSLLRGQRLLKAYSGYTQTGNWPNNPDTCKQVIDLAKLLLDCSLKARQDAEEKNIPEANNLLSSARLTGQAVIRASEKQNWPTCAADLNHLQILFNNVTEYMKSIM